MGSEDFAKRMNIRLKRENQPGAMTRAEQRAWQEEKIWKEGHKTAEDFMKKICSRLKCTKDRFMKERRKNKIFHQGRIHFIVDMRRGTDWTFRHIGRYLELSARHVQNLYHDATRKSMDRKSDN